MILGVSLQHLPDSKVHGASMGPTWGRQDPGGPHFGHMNLAIWAMYLSIYIYIHMDLHACDIIC